MKRHIIPYLLPLLGVLSGLLASCTDELVEDRPATAVVDDTNLVETRLSFDVAAMNTSAVQTRTADDSDDLPSESITEDEKRGTDAERKIDNIWVFQFDATSQKLLITPRYYDLSDKDVIPDATTGKEADVLLKPDVSSIVYVVANIGKAAASGSDWATVHNSATLEEVKKLTLPNPKFIAVDNGENPTDLSLPMEGASQTVTPVKGQKVNVTVTRMYAKVEIYIGDIPESLVLSDVNVAQMPYYCQVGTLATENATNAATYPTIDWNSYAFKPGTKDENGNYTKKLVVYLPENLQGRTGSGAADSGEKTNNAPANAFRVDFVANYVDIFTGEEKERGRHYAVCPGANIYNDYNIRRNFIYRVRLNIYTDLYNQDIPSSNCFVVKPNQSLSFLPYYRTETGGGYKFTDYLDAKGDDDTKKINDSDNMLDNIQIIWQTKDAIGDNSKGDRVWIDRLSEVNDDEYHRKIHVKTGSTPGNALIAAYNKEGKIIWSWHIWVTENEPGNVSNAVVYSTYAWNDRQIFTHIRVPGYAIMPCNLGALKHEPDNVDNLAPETHGMLYQWGRKDPFPPSQSREGNNKDYIDDFTGYHYANDNTTTVGKTAEEDNSKLFHSLAGNNNNFASQEKAISYTIQNPTVFLCGTKETYPHKGEKKSSEQYADTRDNYHNEGDWLPSGVHDNKLWGGLDPNDDGTMKRYTMRSGSNQAHIYDNYGNEKSIFDPCPSGWRVPPGDLWLGFTSTGENPTSYDQINTNIPDNESHTGAGMYLFMNAWKQGTTSFFPTQGTRIPNGEIIRTGQCGNYHNATTDDNNRVNILHVHRKQDLFHVFEVTYSMYYVKSTGGPVRCVRDHK